MEKYRPKVYLAGPIFTERDRMYLDTLYDGMHQIWPDAEIYAPQRNKEINDKTKSAGALDVYWGDYRRLRDTDILVAVISGDLPPIGTTCEIGIFTELMNGDPHRKMIGLLDDMREMSVTHSAEKDAAGSGGIGENQYSYCNIFLTGAIKAHGSLVANSTDLFKAFAKLRDEYGK
jgi:hypothetical protein